MILSVVQKESFYDCLAEPPGFRHGEHQCEGVVGCYSCVNEENCGMMYEIIDLFPDENSKDFEIYGWRFIKYYNPEDFE